MCIRDSLIAETNQKSYWAIQAKYKSDKTSTLTRKDLSTFRDLAFNYCKNIEHGLVCSPISHEPKKSNLMNKMGFALINEWEDLDKDNNKGWKNIQKRVGVIRDYSRNYSRNTVDGQN